MKYRLPPARLSVLVLLCLLSGSALPTPARSEQPIASFRWEDAAKAVSPESLAHVHIIDGPPEMAGKILQVSNSSAQPLQVNVLTISNPRITADLYMLRGRVRYDDVAGDGYLEMWSSFPSGSDYFSRTLGDQPTDPMAKLSGTSGWRPIVLPFNAKGAGAHPEELSVNVVLPGHGTVYLTALELFESNPKRISILSPTLWLGFVVIGVIMIGTCIWGVWRWRLRFRTAEWRRMTALDT